MTQSQHSSSVLSFGFEKFDPYAMMMFLRRRLGIILGVAAIIFVIASGTFFMIPPLYKASSVILIELNSTGEIDREAAAAGVGIDSGFVDSQIEVMKSQALVGRVVKKLNLDKDSEFTHQKGGILSFVSFLSHKLHGVTEADVTSPIVAKFIEFLSIERRGIGYAISVEFTWPDPKKAAEYANALADTYLENQSETRFEQMKRAATWLNNRLAVVAVNVRDAEKAVEQFKAQHNLQDVSGVTVNDQQLSEINALLVEHAGEGRTVVRLKGGDPFVFGRGGEELQALAQARINFSVVPGITAALGAAAYSGIPLTHREFAHSVTFVTGHAQGQGPEPDWRALAMPGTTAVFYMGLARLDHIVAKLLEHGAPATRPAGIIAQATTAKQRVITATLATIQGASSEAKLESPALLVVGDVVALHSTLAWFDTAAGVDLSQSA